VIIDCHTHWGIGWQERDREDPSRWLEKLDEHGVDRTFLLGHNNLARCDLAQEDNERLVRLRDRHPERFDTFGTVWPQMGAESVAEARRCLQERGMAGLKFHPWLQGFSTADPVFAEICGLAGECGAPVVFHDGTPCYSLPEQIGGLARRFPQTTFVLGHAGLLWTWRSALEAARHANVWTCLCGPPMRGVELFCEQTDPGRLLWGSDYGFGFSDPIAYRLSLIRRARISHELREQILEANPLRLLGLG